MAVNHVC